MFGTLKKVYKGLGYGFIKSGNIEYFFHRSSFEGHWDDLCEDYENNIPIEFSFEVSEESAKGPRAEEVRLFRTVV